MVMDENGFQKSHPKHPIRALTRTYLPFVVWMKSSNKTILSQCTCQIPAPAIYSLRPRAHQTIKKYWKKVTGDKKTVGSCEIQVLDVLRCKINVFL